MIYSNKRYSVFGNLCKKADGDNGTLDQHVYALKQVGGMAFELSFPRCLLRSQRLLAEGFWEAVKACAFAYTPEPAVGTQNTTWMATPAPTCSRMHGLEAERGWYGHK